MYESFGAIAAVADDAIAAAFGIVGGPDGLAVMALGRLGSGEFDVLSDVDLLFVCGEDYNREYLTRISEQMMQALAAYTRDGMVFPVDARLRPARGGRGQLLVTPTQLDVYFEHEAQSWEALTYTKLRYVAGSRRLAQRASTATRVLFQRFAADASFPQAIREMRAKVEAVEAPELNFKTSPGGTSEHDF